jgi:hypothetical protein
MPRSGSSAAGIRAYRPGLRQYLMSAGLFGFLIFMCALVALTRDRSAWRMMPWVAAPAIWSMLQLMRARLEISPDRVVYTSLWRGTVAVPRHGLQRIGWATTTRLFESKVYPRFQVLGENGAELRIQHRLFPPAALKELIAWAGDDLQGGDGEEESP